MSFLADVFEWEFQHFVGELTDPTGDYSEYQLSLLYLVSAITSPKTSLKAITTSLERVDGKQPDKLEVIFPKFYTLYPNATSVAGGEPSTTSTPTPTPEPTPEPEIPDESVKGLRAEIQRLSEQKRGYVDQVILAAELIMAGKESINQPKVKTVAAAMLYRLSRSSMLALDTLLEQVEGKVKDKVELLGGDVYLTSFAEVAPAGAIKNSNGIYQIENEQATTLWTERLDASRKLRG